MIFAPETFKDFLKHLFVVNEETIKIFNRDPIVDGFSHYGTIINKIVNKEFLSSTNDTGTVAYLDRLLPNKMHIVEIGHIGLFQNYYNDKISLKVFLCTIEMENLTICYELDSSCRSCVQIPFLEVEKYFRQNLLKTRKWENRIDYIQSRFEIMEIE